MDKEQMERKLREIHEYARHIFQLYIAWFTFFVTANYVSMGWLAKPNDDGKSYIALVVGSLFVLQNALGAIATKYVWRCLHGYNVRVTNLEASALQNYESGDDNSSMPMNLYSAVCILALVTLLTIAVAWVIIVGLILTHH